MTSPAAPRTTVQVCCSSSADVAAEYWLDVNDWRPIQRFEMAHPHASAFDGGDLDPVQANGIGAVRRARTEDAFLRPGGVPSWVHGQNVATRAIEPGDDDNLIAGPEVPETFKYLRLEDQPGLGYTFVGLEGGRPRSVRGDATLPMAFTSKLVKRFTRSAWVRSITYAPSRFLTVLSPARKTLCLSPPHAPL